MCVCRGGGGEGVVVERTGREGEDHVVPEAAGPLHFLEDGAVWVVGMPQREHGLDKVVLEVHCSRNRKFSVAH